MSTTPSMKVLTETINTRRIARLEEALKDIARQKLGDEMTDEEAESGDFEGAYDTMILVARSALA